MFGHGIFFGKDTYFMYPIFPNTFLTGYFFFFFFYSYKLTHSQSTTRVLHILLHISINLAFKVIFTKKKKNYIYKYIYTNYTEGKDKYINNKAIYHT